MNPLSRDLRRLTCAGVGVGPDHCPCPVRGGERLTGLSSVWRGLGALSLSTGGQSEARGTTCTRGVLGGITVLG